MEILRTIVLYVEGKDMPFAVIGGHAVNAYGIARHTADLDLAARSSDRDAWFTLMGKLNYTVGQSDGQFAKFSPGSLAAWPIDFMFVDDDTLSKLLDDSVETTFGAARARVVSARHLATLKIHSLRHFQAHRYAKDLSDLVSLLRSGNTGLSDSDLKDLCVRYADVTLYERLKQELPLR